MAATDAGRYCSRMRQKLSEKADALMFELRLRKDHQLDLNRAAQIILHLDLKLIGFYGI